MVAMGVAAILAVGHPSAAQAQGSGPASLELRTLSTRPETVSGGEVLVHITVPRGVSLERVAVAVNGRDVRAAFRPGSQAQTLVGPVDRLNVGPNRLEASAPGQRRADLTLVNHPMTGPVIAGPHQTPFICETEAFGLGAALEVAFWAFALVVLVVVGVLFGTGLYLRRHV